MSTKKLSSQEKLERIAESLVEEVLRSPADEVQQELDGGEEQPRFGRAAYAMALERVGKRRLANAKAELATQAGAGYAMRAMSRERKLELLKKMATKAGGALTMAARNAREMGDAEVDAALESFIALGLLDPHTES